MKNRNEQPSVKQKKDSDMQNRAEQCMTNKTENRMESCNRNRDMSSNTAKSGMRAENSVTKNSRKEQ